MTYLIDHTHDRHARSWVACANVPGCDFPIQNLPLCVFSREGEVPRGGIGLGNFVIDTRQLMDSGLLHGEALAAAKAAAEPALNSLMAMPAAATLALRHAVFALFSETPCINESARQALDKALVLQTQVAFHLPCKIGGYTDFLTSRYHTERNGRLKGLKDPLPAAFLHLPVAYNGRTSSMRVSGADVMRPMGQYRTAAGQVIHAPSAALDFELEMGAFVRGSNALGSRLTLDKAEERLFGLALFNDWSAKDIQWWEQVLGPFLGKSFLTSVSPWIVTLEALAPFRTALADRLPDDPPTLPYLYAAANEENGAFSVSMEAYITSKAMHEEGLPAAKVASTNLSCLYWTFAQMLTHHTGNGCNMEPGDFIGSGTVSGEDISTAACLTEIGRGGKTPIAISPHESRAWLQDGDTVMFKARAEREGFVTIGFGECTGTVMAACG